MNGRPKSSALGRWLGSLWRTPVPTVGCEISHTGISIARWSRRSDSLDTAAWKPIPSGAVEASPLRDNIQKPDDVQKAFAEALSSLGISPSAASARKTHTDAVLVIPDQAARLFVLNFETFPDKMSESLPLVKWRLKKSLPFDIESAAISYFVQRSGAELQVIAVATPQWVVGQYEAVAQQFGLRPRSVILSTLASLGLIGDGDDSSPLLIAEADGQAAGTTGVLIAKYSPPWFTTAILQRGTLRLFRTVALAAGDDGALSPADVLSSIYPSIAYFQDNFQGSVARAYLCGLGEDSESIAAALEQELHLRTSSLVPDLDGLVSNADREHAERHFASLLGVAREQQNG